MIAKAFEEDSPAQRGNLKCVEVDVDFVVVPGIGSKAIRNESCKDTVEVE